MHLYQIAPNISTMDTKKGGSDMRIYISGPITGTEGYRERFEAAEKMINAAGYVAINPEKVNRQLPVVEHKDYMLTSIAMLQMCDAVLMLPGWKESRGCVMEFEYAYEHSIHIFFAEVKNGEKA